MGTNTKKIYFDIGETGLLKKMLIFSGGEDSPNNNSLVFCIREEDIKFLSVRGNFYQSKIKTTAELPQRNLNFIEAHRLVREALKEFPDSEITLFTTKHGTTLTLDEMRLYDKAQGYFMERHGKVLATKPKVVTCKYIETAISSSLSLFKMPIYKTSSDPNHIPVADPLILQLKKQRCFSLPQKVPTAERE